MTKTWKNSQKCRKIGKNVAKLGKNHQKCQESRKTVKNVEKPFKMLKRW